jgi:hypothetical protein
MAKKESIKIPKAVDLAKLIAMGQAAEKEFKQDAIKQVSLNEPNNSIPETSKEDISDYSDNQPQSFSNAEETAIQVKDTEIRKGEEQAPVKKKNDEFQGQKTQEETPVPPSLDVPFEEFLKKYIPADTDKRESAYVYTTNLYILKAIATSEGSVINDMINNIISAWIQKYNKNIKKSLQKPSKIFGL